MANTTSGRTVFVLGREVDGNREVLVVDDGVEYTIDPATRYAYSDDLAEFPYSV